MLFAQDNAQGGGSLLGALVILTPIIGVFVLAWMRHNGILRSTRVLHVTSEVPAEPHDATRKLHLALSGMRNVVVSEPSPGVLQVRWQHYPTWSIVVAVLLFPIGCLALLARRTDLGTIALEPSPSGCRLHVAGTFSDEAADALASMLTMPVEAPAKERTIEAPAWMRNAISSVRGW